MTYKNITVNNISPDSNNNITLNINNIESNISGSPSNNQMLKYESSNWINGSASTASTSDLYYSFWNHESYSTSTVKYAVGDWIVWRGGNGAGETITKSSGVSTNASNSSDNGIVTSSAWVQSITISDAGTYKLTASIPNETTHAEGYLTIRWHDGSNYFGPKATLYEKFKLNNILMAVTTITAETTFSIRIVEKSSYHHYLGDSQEGYVTSINVIKLS